MTMNSNARPMVAIVTGCGQGLGAETCSQLAAKGHVVVATYRNLQQTRNKNYLSESQAIHHEQMDVTSDEEVAAVVSRTLSKFGSIDILVNNAGVYLDREPSNGIEMMPLILLKETLEINLVGAARVMHAVLPSMIRQKFGSVVNVSSGMGRVVELAGDSIYYRTSKSALTALTRCVSQRVAGHGITVNAVCPGWVRSAMGGSAAIRSVEEGAAGIVSAALSPRKNGVLLRDSEDFGW